MATDPFDVLGVPRDATLPDVQEAWRRQCALYRSDRYQGAPADIQTEAARRMTEASLAYDAIVTRAGTHVAAESRGPAELTRATAHVQTRSRSRTWFTATALAVLIALVAVAAVVFVGRGTVNSTASGGRSRPTAQQWLTSYHHYLDAVHTKVNAGPTITGTSGSVMQDSENSILAVQQFCSDMRTYVRDHQGVLFPSPNAALDQTLGAWIDSVVAYWGTCPLSFTNANASSQLGSAMEAKQSAVARLVDGLTR
jgi:hypothetical protein